MPPRRIGSPREPTLSRASAPLVAKDTQGGSGSAIGGFGLGGWGFLPGSTGQAVTPVASLGIATAWACVKRLAEDNGKLPRRIMRRLPGGGMVEVPKHPLAKLLRNPNRWQTPSQCWGYLTTWLALRGNCYAVVGRGPAGEPTSLTPVSPDRVSVLMSTGGEIYYQITHPALGMDGKRFHRDNVMHVRSAISFDGFTGASPIAAAPDVFGLGIATQQHGAVLFRQGAQLSGIIKHPGKLTTEAKDYLRAKFSERHGGVQNAHGTAVLDEGMGFEKVTMTNLDSQFLESRQFTVPEVCFTPDALVLTDAGARPISEVTAGTLVLTHKGRWQRVSHVSRTPYVGRVLTVRAKGLDAVTVTPGHPFLMQPARATRTHKVGVDGEPRWTEAGALRPARRQSDGRRARGAFDTLTMPRVASGAGQVVDLATWAPAASVLAERTLVSSARARPTPITRHVPANADLGWVCGLFAADGSASESQSIFYLGAHETTLVERLERVVPALFGAVANTSVRNSVARVVISSRVVAAFFSQFGHRAPEKALPAWCMSADNTAEFRAALLEGLVDGDGHVPAGRTDTVLRTTSRALVWQVRLLLWSAGVNSYVVSTAAGEYAINGRSGAAAEIFNVGWQSASVRRGTMLDAGNVVALPLESVDATHFAGFVYNLQVDGDESYATTGGVVHNCRMFGVPPHKVHDLSNAHFANMEQGNLQYWSDTLQPIGKQYEEECGRVMLFDDEADDLVIQIDYDELMRSDRRTRYQTDEIGIRSGRLTQNEARVSDGREPNVPDGDQFLTPLNMQGSGDKPDANITEDEKPEPAAQETGQ